MSEYHARSHPDYLDVAEERVQPREGTEYVTFTLNGERFRLWLSQENHERLFHLLGPFLRAARMAHTVDRVSTSRSERDENKAIREWSRGPGKEMGLEELGWNGRISPEHRFLYRAWVREQGSRAS